MSCHLHCVELGFRVSQGFWQGLVVFPQSIMLYLNVAVQEASHSATQTGLGCAVVAPLCTGLQLKA